MSNPQDHIDFYRKQWPALTLPDWEPTGAVGYGLIWWHKSVETGYNDLTARLCFIVAPTSTRISLEVRHKYHGMATAEIGDGTMSPAAIAAKVTDALPGAVSQVIEQYEAWEKALA